MNEHFSITDDDETAYRERATALLYKFAEQARGVLRDAGIGIDLIFVVPPSGDVILTFWYGRRIVQRGFESHQSDCVITRPAVDRAGSGPGPGGRVCDGAQRQYSRFIQLGGRDKWTGRPAPRGSIQMNLSTTCSTPVVTTLVIEQQHAAASELGSHRGTRRRCG